jgi:hypothetical protein
MVPSVVLEQLVDPLMEALPFMAKADDWLNRNPRPNKSDRNLTTTSSRHKRWKPTKDCSLVARELRNRYQTTATAFGRKAWTSRGALARALPPPPGP